MTKITPDEKTGIPAISNMAAAMVVVGSLVFVLSLILVLYFQIAQIGSFSKLEPISEKVMSLMTTGISEERLNYLGKLVMEAEAQLLRTTRAQSLVSARLTVMVFAELIGLILSVLGGAFIFARITGAGSFNVQADDGGKSRKLNLLSDFPGVFLCFFGAMVVMWAVSASVSKNSKFLTTDTALFLDSDRSTINADSSRTQKDKNVLYKNCMAAIDNAKECRK